jgi:hypothetical protein
LAAQRLALDGRLCPVAELTAVAGASPDAVVRWITAGKGGVYLDGIHDPFRGWCSTVAAVERFHRDRAEREGGAA